MADSIHDTQLDLKPVFEDEVPDTIRSHPVVGCIRCFKPCALVDDKIPQDQLCPWCRGSGDKDTPGVNALWLKECVNGEL